MSNAGNISGSESLRCDVVVIVVEQIHFASSGDFLSKTGDVGIRKAYSVTVSNCRVNLLPLVN